MAIHIIATPRSGLSSHLPQELATLQGLLAGKALVHLSDNEATLRQQLTSLHAAKTRAIAIRGGDGTLRLTLHWIVRIWQNDPLPAILLLRGGTMNVIATSVGVHGKPESILRRFLQSQARGQVASQPLAPMLVAGQLGFIFGMGAFVGFLQHYYQVPKPTPWRGLSLMLQTLGSMLVAGHFSRQLFAPLPIGVRLDGTAVLQQPWTLFTASSVRYAGLGATPYTLAQTPGHPIHFIASSACPRKLCLQLPWLYQGNLRRDGIVTSQACQRLELTHAQPLPYCLDGDIMPAASNLTIERGPIFEMLTP